MTNCLNHFCAEFHCYAHVLDVVGFNPTAMVDVLLDCFPKSDLMFLFLPGSRSGGVVGSVAVVFPFGNDFMVLAVVVRCIAVVFPIRNGFVVLIVFRDGFHSSFHAGSHLFRFRRQGSLSRLRRPSFHGGIVALIMFPTMGLCYQTN